MREAPIKVALLVRLAAVLTAALGVIVLAGWAVFILGIRPSPPLQRLAQALALAVGALGLATLGEYPFGWQLGIDEWLFRDTASAFNVNPGRMSPYGAVAFVLLGAGTLLATRRPVTQQGRRPIARSL